MDINFNIGFGKIDSLSWDSSLLKIQFSNGEVMVYENITFTEYQQLLSYLTAADNYQLKLCLMSWKCTMFMKCTMFIM